MLQQGNGTNGEGSELDLHIQQVGVPTVTLQPDGNLEVEWEPLPNHATSDVVLVTPITHL